MANPTDAAIAQAFRENAAENYWDKSARWENVREVIERRARELDAEKGGEVKPCTCHPDDNPPVPCARKYALTECKATPPAQAAEADPVQAATSKAVMAVMAQREEIVRAFVAKYGFQPDEAMQVSTPNGWYITRREQAAEAVERVAGAMWHTYQYRGKWPAMASTPEQEQFRKMARAAIAAMQAGEGK